MTIKSTTSETVNRVIVITPAKNASGTIEDTIQSIQRNALPLEIPVTHLIVCPKNDTTKKAAERAWGSYEKGSVEVKFLEDNGQGIYQAMNQGLEYVTNLLKTNEGESAEKIIVSILNADDTYTSRCLEQVVRAFNSDSTLKCVYGDLCFVNPTSSSSIVRLWVAGKLQDWKFLFGWMPPHPTVFFDAEVYLNQKFKPEKFGTSSDYELMLRLLYRKGLKVKYLNSILVRMRVGGASSKARLKALRDDYSALRDIGLNPVFATVAVCSKKARAVLQIIKTRLRNFIKTNNNT
jgi:glycosyltransferase